MNSSVVTVFSWGRPSSSLRLGRRARSNRPLLATTTRSVTSRRTGLEALRKDPQATEPVAPSAFCQTTSPRNSRPSSSCRIRITSAERLR